jgi:hypothetical protein
MIGRIVQVREYTDKPNKFFVIELTDEDGLHDAVKYHDSIVIIEPDWPMYE